MIILIRRQRHLKYPLKWIQHLSRLLDLVEPKFGKVKKSYSKFQGRITNSQLTWKQRADVVYFHLHMFLGIETLSSCLACSNCNYPSVCSAPSNFVIGFNLWLTNSAQARFRCYALTHSFCIPLFYYFILSTFVHQIFQKPAPPRAPPTVWLDVWSDFSFVTSCVMGTQKCLFSCD